MFFLQFLFPQLITSMYCEVNTIYKVISIHGQLDMVRYSKRVRYNTVDPYAHCAQFDKSTNFKKKL